jgi:hypothetical protein
VNIHKIISTVLHPIVIPTIGVMLYFLVAPISLKSNQKFAVLSLVFVITYLIPLLILILFKKIKLIKSYNTETIKERKIPVAIMIVLFFLLGNTLNNITSFRDLSFLFYGTCLGLTLIYLLFFFKLKSSIHLLSLGVSISYFMILSSIYNRSYILIILIIILLSGILASSRLHLKAHTTKEIYVGFFIGIVSPLSIYIFL